MSTRPISPPAGNPAAPTPSARSEDPSPAGPVARVGVTSDQIEAEVALAKGTVADGVDLELFSASAKLTEDEVIVQGAVRTSVTGGLSAGVGAELGVGVRDLDKDNNPELCARVSVLFFTLGACVESPL